MQRLGTEEESTSGSVRETDGPSRVRCQPVSFSLAPDLLEEAKKRSAELGLTFSRYVSLCVRAELGGGIADLLSDPAGPGSHPEANGEATAALEEAFRKDVAETLNELGVSSERSTLAPGALETAGGRQLILCRYPWPEGWEATLGRLVYARQQHAEVLLVVPYKRSLPNFVGTILAKEGIPVTTLDGLAEWVDGE